jgi:hypothetical protein
MQRRWLVSSGKLLAICNEHGVCPHLVLCSLTVACPQAVLSDEELKSVGVLRVGDRAKVCESLDTAG